MNTREYWVKTLTKITSPVLKAAVERKLRETLPIAGSTDDTNEYSYLEIVGRTLAGLSPWLELEIEEGWEKDIQNEYQIMAREAIDAITDPNSPDYANFGTGERPFEQPIVDAAFLSHAIIRAPKQLWELLDEKVKKNLICALKQTRKIRPARSNWLLFSAMIETALYVMGEEFDKMRVDYAIYQHEQNYKGDGVYGDGTSFAWDYYNSYVMQPMLLDIIYTLGFIYKESYNTGDKMKETILTRAKRYAFIQERLISNDGTFPVLGRSITYRCGVFQLLAQVALMSELPDEISPAQVRCALTAVIRQCIEKTDTFDENGWLKIGLSGYQPSLGEVYIHTSSLYLCTTAFLPLGLPVQDDFWNSPDELWTWQKVWAGQDMKADHCIY